MSAPSAGPYAARRRPGRPGTRTRTQHDAGGIPRRRAPDMTPHASSGFSLVELLVVVSIIAVLAGMLLPALGLVRTQARSMTCAANLRQIGYAYTAYAADYDGAVMDSAAWGAGLPLVRWSDHVADYTDGKRSGNGSGNVDTAQRQIVANCPEWKPLSSWELGYGANRTPDAPYNPSHTNRWDYGNLNGNERHFTFSRISHQASRLMVCDSNDWHTLAVVVNVRRHGGRFNAVFFDGHVQSLAGASGLSAAQDHPELGTP